MHDVRDPVLGDGALELREVGDVADQKGDSRQLVRRHDQPQPVRVVAEVVRDDRHALFDEQPARPRAETSERASDEEPLRHRRRHPPPWVGKKPASLEADDTAGRRTQVRRLRADLRSLASPRHARRSK